MADRSTKKRHRRRSTSSESSSTDDSAKERRSQRKMIKKLSKQLGDLQEFIYRREVPLSIEQEATIASCATPLQHDTEFSDHSENIEEQIPFKMPDPSVSLKEPLLPAPAESLLQTVKRLQCFDSAAWNDVRYAKVMKEYVADPGFKELEVNAEIQHLDTGNAVITGMEKAFAAITKCH